jgi:hypothetical protein
MYIQDPSMWVGSILKEARAESNEKKWETIQYSKFTHKQIQ